MGGMTGTRRETKVGRDVVMGRIWGLNLTNVVALVG